MSRCHVSCVRCHLLGVMCQLSAVTSHMSWVTCHLSHVTNTNSQSHGPFPCYLANYAQHDSIAGLYLDPKIAISKTIVLPLLFLKK